MNNRKDKESFSHPRLKEAERDYKDLMREIAPFVKKTRKAKNHSTSGNWSVTGRGGCNV